MHLPGDVATHIKYISACNQALHRESRMERDEKLGKLFLLDVILR